jgi:putative Mg2+ transporter-C (MgtC) family protein
MSFDAEVVGKVLVSLALGAAIGVEREYFRKPAGIRTNCLICLGATLFTILSLKVDAVRGDPARIAAQIIPGVGFLGAGAILRDQGRVVGLTTAAGIWMVAAVGMAIGAGYYAIAVLATAVALLVLRALDVLENWIDQIAETREYLVRVADDAAAQVAERLFHDSGLRAVRRKQMRDERGLTDVWYTHGRKRQQEELASRLLREPAVVEFSW